MLAIMVYNWRALSDAIGFGIAKKRKAQKKNRTVQIIVWMATWLTAIVVLLQKCNGIFCQVPAQPTTPSQIVTNAVGTGPGPSLPFLDVVIRLNSLVQSSWFYLAFLGFLVFSSVIIARGVMVSLKETKDEAVSELVVPNPEGAAAVTDAIRMLRTELEVDARTRIIKCYERMINAAQRVGLAITSDKTARELEASIRKMLLVKGAAIKTLTDLFEEARYSLHAITEDDVGIAQKCLVDIAHELNIPVSV